MANFDALSRFKLSDLHQPTQIAETIHAMLTVIEGPIPVIEIAKALDVSQVKLDAFDGFEGMLLTDVTRRDGVIVANTRNGLRRAGFTVAHELGHFLMERHTPSNAKGFQCLSSDMRKYSVSQRHDRQETEANRFAIELLAPRYKLEQHIAGDPDLDHVRMLSQDLDLSAEATARRYRELHEDRIAMVFHHNGIVRYFDKSDDFLYLMPQVGSAVPGREPSSPAGTLTECVAADPKDWFDGPPKGELWIQTLYQHNGYGITLLILDEDGLDDDAEDTYERFSRRS